MKRILILSVIWSTCVLIPALVVMAKLFPPPSPLSHPRGPSPLPEAYASCAGTVLTASVVVLFIFGVDIAVLWLLRKIGGPLKADVTATIKVFEGNVVIASAGLVGCFLAIAALAYVGIYLFIYLMKT